MPTCSFSGKEIPPGTGIMYVKSDGKVLWFADSKSEKNYLLKRKPRNITWTAEARKAKQAAMHAKESGKTPVKATKTKAAKPAKEKPAAKPAKEAKE